MKRDYQPLYIGADNNLWYGSKEYPITLESDGSPVTNATASFRLLDEDEDEIPGATGTFVYRPTDDGRARYLGVVTGAMTAHLTEGDIIVVELTANAGGANDKRRLFYEAQYRGAESGVEECCD